MVFQQVSWCSRQWPRLRASVMLLAALSSPSLAYAAPHSATPGMEQALANAPLAERPAHGVENAPPQAQEATSLSGTYLSSRFARTRGDMERAAAFLKRSYQADQENQDLAREAMDALLLVGQVAEAASIANTLPKDVQKQPLVLMTRVVGAIARQAPDEAQTLLNNSEPKGVFAILVPLLSGWMDVGAGTIQKPLSLDEQTASARGWAPFIYYQLALMNDIAGFPTEAEQYYTKAIRATDRMPFRVVEAFGNFYERQGERAKAMSLYSEYQAANPESALLEGKELLPSKEASTPPRIVTTAQEGMAELFYTLASVVYTPESPEDALIYLRLATALRSNFPPAQLMIGNVLEEMDEYKAAMATFDGVDQRTPYYHKAKLRSALVQEQMGETAKALAQLDAIAAANPGQYDIWVTKGDVLRRHSRFKEAATAYGEAIKRIGELRAQHWSLLFVRGICLDQSGQWAKAEEDFQRALALEPAEPEVLNYLGYSWLMQGKNIPEALHMINLAVEQRPEEAHIVDSMGWALYLTGDFDAATEYLERAAALDPADPTINDHLGDAYWRLDRKNEARFQWQRALNFSPEAAHAAAIQKKLANGMERFTPLVSGVGTAQRVPSPALSMDDDGNANSDSDSNDTAPNTKEATPNRPLKSAPGMP